MRQFSPARKRPISRLQQAPLYVDPDLRPGRRTLHWCVDIRCTVHLDCPTMASGTDRAPGKVTEFVRFDISAQVKSPAVYGTEGRRGSAVDWKGHNICADGGASLSVGGLVASTRNANVSFHRKLLVSHRTPVDNPPVEHGEHSSKLGFAAHPDKFGDFASPGNEASGQCR